MSQIANVLDKSRLGDRASVDDDGAASRPYHHGDLSRALVLAGRRILEKPGCRGAILESSGAGGGGQPRRALSSLQG